MRAQSQGHHTIDCLEERGVERGSARRERESHRQSDEHWNRFKGNVGETFERQSGAPMGFTERLDTILNRTELIYRNVCICSLRLSSPPQVFLFHGRGSDIAVSPNTNLSICPMHSCKVGSCKEKTCAALHLCMFFLLSGKCAFKDRCLFGHDLNTDHNRKRLQDHLLGGLNMTELRTLFCLPWVRRGVTVPSVCR